MSDEKKMMPIRDVLERCRQYIGGLSQYDKRFLPQSAFDEAKVILSLIAPHQLARENTHPDKMTALERAAFEGKKLIPKGAFGGFHESGECLKHRCQCDKFLEAMNQMGCTHEDKRLWEETSEKWYVSSGPTRFIGTAAPGLRYWTDVSRSEEVKVLIARVNDFVRTGHAV